jgi:hypothetical protein
VQLGWRSPLHELEKYRGSAVEADLLLPWLAQAQAADGISALRRFGEPEAAEWRLQGDGSPEDEQLEGELWELYALARVVDVLITPYQASARRGRTRGR